MQIAKSAKLKNSKFESNDVRIESGARLQDVFIKAKKVIIKSNATLTNCKLFSDGVVTIGENTTVKEQVIINAFKSIYIGDRTIIDRDVTIGGMQSEKSEIEIGNDCVVLYRSYLNVTRKISIGNNVGIGGYCLIFTHSAWQNVLNGNPYKFAEVEIKDNAWLPWNVTVMPGITINKDVTIGSGSVITKNLPSGVFAAGIPAKVIRKKAAGNLSKTNKNNIMLEILSDFQGYASQFLQLNSIAINSNNCIITSSKKDRLVYTKDFKKIKNNDVIISFKIPDQIKRNHEWIELDSLYSHTTRDIAKYFISFVRRYGIKIKPNS